MLAQAMKRIAAFIETHASAVVSVILLLAAILRVAALFNLKGSIYFDFLLWDERIYHEWAKRIADGTNASRSVYEFAPLPAYLTALVYKALSPSPFYVRVLNIVWGVLSCWMIYRIGRELAGKTVGVLSCLVAALYGPFIFYSIVPLKTSLSIFSLALCLVLFLSLMNLNPEDRSSARKALILSLGLGLVSGLMIQVRGNYMVLVPAIPLFMLVGLRRNAGRRRSVAMILALFLVGLVAALSPFVIRNVRAAGELSLTTSQTGRNLYFGNNPGNDTPYYLPLPFASSVPNEQAVQFVIEASRRTGPRLTQAQANAFWTREVLRTARDHPLESLGKLGRKALAFLNRFESSDHYHIGFLSRFVPFFRIPFIDIGLILPLGMAGLLFFGFRSRKTLALSVLFLLYAGSLVATVMNARYRLPMLAILIPFAVMGVLDAGRSFCVGRWRGAGLFGALVALFAIIEFLPLRGVGDLSSYYNTHAYILNQKERTDEAVEFWETSSRMKGSFSPVADLYLAGKYYQRGDRAKAFRAIDRISDDSFAAASKYSLLGDIYLQEGDREKEIAAYEKSLAINAGQQRIRKELIRLYAVTDPARMQEQQKDLEEIQRFFRDSPEQP